MATARLLCTLAATAVAALAGGAAAADAAGAAVYELVYTCGDNLCRIGSDGTGQAQLTTDGSPSQAYRGPSFNADGTRLAFRRGDQVFVSAPDTSGRVEVSAGNINTHISISPDAQTVAVGQMRMSLFGGFTNWVKLWRADGTGSPWADNEGAVASGWLGNRVFMDQPKTREALCLWLDNGSCERWVADDPRRDLYNADGSPDARYVVSDATDPATGASAIALFDASTGALLRDLTAGPADSSPDISPDGVEVAFERAGQLVVLPLAGGAERALGAGGAPAWGAARQATAPTTTTTPGATPSGLLGRVTLATRRVRARTGLRLTVVLTGAARVDVVLTRRAGRRWQRIAKVTKRCRTSPCRIAVRRVRRTVGGRRRITLLPAGAYRAKVTATAGAAAATRTVTFRVVRR